MSKHGLWNESMCQVQKRWCNDVNVGISFLVEKFRAQAEQRRGLTSQKCRFECGRGYLQILGYQAASQSGLPALGSCTGKKRVERASGPGRARTGSFPSRSLDALISEPVLPTFLSIITTNILHLYRYLASVTNAASPSTRSLATSDRQETTHVHPQSRFTGCQDRPERCFWPTLVDSVSSPGTTPEALPSAVSRARALRGSGPV